MKQLAPNEAKARQTTPTQHLAAVEAPTNVFHHAPLHFFIGVERDMESSLPNVCRASRAYRRTSFAMLRKQSELDAEKRQRASAARQTKVERIEAAKI